MQDLYEKRMDRKKKTMAMADNMLKEKGSVMNRAEKAFVKTFARKDAMPSETANVSKEKAKQILKEGEAQGSPLTEKQRKMFGAIAGGK